MHVRYSVPHAFLAGMAFDQRKFIMIGDELYANHLRNSITGFLATFSGLLASAIGSAINVRVLGEVSPWVISLLMTSLGGLQLVGLVYVQKRKRMGSLIRKVRRDRVFWRRVLSLAVCNVAIFTLVTYAGSRLALGTVNAITLVGPVAVGAWRLVRVKHGRGRIWALLPVLALFGVVVMNNPLTGEFDAVGFVAASVASMALAGWVIVNKKMEVSGYLTEGKALSTVFAFTMMWVATLLLGNVLRLPDFAVQGVTWHILGIAGLSGFLGLVLAAILQNAAFRRMSEHAVSVLTTLQPGAGFIAGWLLLSQEVTAQHMCGMILVVGAGIGVFLADRPARAERVHG